MPLKISRQQSFSRVSPFCVQFDMQSLFLNEFSPNRYSTVKQHHKRVSIIKFNWYYLKFLTILQFFEAQFKTKCTIQRNNKSRKIKFTNSFQTRINYIAAPRYCATRADHFARNKQVVAFAVKINYCLCRISDNIITVIWSKMHHFQKLNKMKGDSCFLLKILD